MREKKRERGVKWERKKEKGKRGKRKGRGRGGKKKGKGRMVGNKRGKEKEVRGCKRKRTRKRIGA